MSDPRGSKPLRGFFDLQAAPEKADLFKRLRYREAYEESLHTNIDDGENPFRVWRMHYGETQEAVASILNISLQDYQTIEKNVHWADKLDVDAFCTHFKRHPVDMLSDTDVMPTCVADALVERALDKALLAVKREKARFAIMDEIEKSARVFAQARLHLRLVPGRQPDTLAARAFETLKLTHPLAGKVDSFSEVRNLLIDKAYEYEDLAGEAQLRIGAFYNKNHRLRRKQARFMPLLLELWDRINEDGGSRAGDLLDQRIQKSADMQTLKREFSETPEKYGVTKWPSVRRAMIAGRSYDWEQANDEFFDLLGRWLAYNTVRDMWVDQRDTLNAELNAFEKWMDSGVGQDTIQAFANICLFNRVFAGDAEIQAKLAVFRPTRTNDAALNGVFKAARPC